MQIGSRTVTSEEVARIMSESKTFRDIVVDELSKISVPAALAGLVSTKITGMPETNIKHPALDKIDAEIMGGNIICAIKEFRKTFDSSLQDAKAWCEKRRDVLKSGVLTSNSADFLKV